MVIIMAKIGILGGGSWGIALAVLLHKNGHEITVWSALESEIRMLEENREHKMLPGVKLSEDTEFTTDRQKASAISITIPFCVICNMFSGAYWNHLTKNGLYKGDGRGDQCLCTAGAKNRQCGQGH